MSIQVTKQQHCGHLCHQLQNNSVWERSGVLVLSALCCLGTESSLPLPPSRKSQQAQPTLPYSISSCSNSALLFAALEGSSYLVADIIRLELKETSLYLLHKQWELLGTTTKQWGWAEQGQAPWHSHLSPCASATKLKC